MSMATSSSRGLALVCCAVLTAAWAGPARADQGEETRSRPSTFRYPRCPGGDLFARTELFFGTNKPDGSVVTPPEWQAFLDQEITPRFPDGLTVLTGRGQFRGESGVIIEEDSFILVLLYPPNTTDSAEVDEIREAYKARFEQESVLRTDSRACVSF